MKVLGAYLRDKRKGLNLTIQEVADKLNLKYGTVANMETGAKNPTLEQLKTYGLILGCEWTEILDKVLKMVSEHTKKFNKNLTEFIDEGKSYTEMQFAEFEEFQTYFKDIMKEYEEEKAKENLKINNDIEAVIKIFVDRWTTKDSTPVSQKDIADFREEIIHSIGLRAKHLTQR